LMDGLHFRDATLDDANFYADVFTALRPTRPTDPVVERYRWEQPDDTYVSRRWVVQRDGRDIGVATFDHPAWARLQVPHGDIGGDLMPERRDRSTLDALLAEMERRLVAEGARRVGLRAPDMHEDRIWLAREGADVVGVSVLGYPPVRGVVGTAWTATARRVRGRGIARALKCETLVQAIALGVDRVQTGNDGANDPILHINASMGYRRWVGAINFLKDVPAG